MKKTTVSCLVMFLVACQPNPNRWSLTSERSTEPPSELATKASTPTITVTNIRGEPMEGAQILIGSRLGQPFINNLIQTDSAGKVSAPKEWNGPMSVTVSHPGYMRVTYLNIAPRALSFKLRPLEKNQRIPLSGTTTGFGPLKQNNVADFGLVLASLTKRDLFSFNLDKIISTEMDTMEIAGQEAKIPSNITFPRQKESYVIPVTLEKERYHIYFNEPGDKKVYALHGKFPFQQVVDRIRKKTPFPNLINYFEFNSGTMRDILVSGPIQVTLPVNEMTFTSQDTLVPPAMEADKVMLSIALFEKQGYLYPTDLHKVESSEPFQLRGLDKTKRVFLSMILRADDFYATRPTQEAVSAEMVDHATNHSPKFIGLFSQPQGSFNGWTTRVPEAAPGIMPLSTYAIFSRVLNDGKQKSIFREWEVYSENWINSAELPEWPQRDQRDQNTSNSQDSLAGQGMNEGRRWEVTYIGTNQKLPMPTSARLGPDLVDYASHISFNSVEF